MSAIKLKDGLNGAVVSTTAPSSPSIGDQWFDSTSGTTAMKVWSGAQWDQMSNKFAATGGTITTSGGYNIHTFTSSGTFSVTAGTIQVEYLIVAGGGGGGSDAGGGGGAGGMRTGTQTVTEQDYSITVGGGGGHLL
jgi:hypothetical protein